MKSIENFNCKECGKECTSWRSFSHHIRKVHNGKEYFDKFIKTDNDNKCKICGSPTAFISLQNGYRITCDNTSCTKELKEKTRKQNNYDKYGVVNVFQTVVVREKIKSIKKFKYNDENYNNHQQFQKTCLEKYGVDTPWKLESTKEKSKQTCLKKYGTEYSFQNKDVRDKGKLTCFKKFGVEHQSQNKEIHEKQQRTGFRLKKYCDEITYRGTYELDFLEKHIILFPDMINGPTIKYLFNDKLHHYFPDFYIPSQNLIVEIKSSYYAKKDKLKIEAKKQAAIDAGFNYVMVVDKDYSVFIL